MKIDLRARDANSVENLLDCCKKAVDGISVGDDGCPHKVPLGDEALKLRSAVEAAGLEFRWVTPKLPESHIDAFIATAKRLCEGGDTFALTVNDTGMLHACLEEQCLPQTVTIGRTIARSVQDCPWIDHVARASSDFSNRLRFQNNMFDDFKIGFFARYRARSIETNWLSRDESSLARIRQRGVGVAVHLGHPSSAVSRSCPSARYAGRPVPQCRDFCNTPIALQLSQIQTGTEFCAAPEDGTHPYDMLLLGNILYQKTFLEPTAAQLTACADRLVVNAWQFSDDASLADYLKALQPYRDGMEGLHAKSQD